MKLASAAVMREYAPYVQPTDLSLAHTPTAAGEGDAPPEERPADSDSLGPSQGGRDPFLLRAIREHAAGSIDPALWAHAMAQARDDRTLATRLYLNSRATALRVEKRKDEAAKRAGVVEALSKEPDHHVDEVRNAARAPAVQRAQPGAYAGTNRKRLVVIGATVAAVVVGAGILLALRPGSAPPQAASVAKAKAPTTATISKKMAASESQGVSPEDLSGKVRAQKEAGNWNLLVIYASEWTRKQPTNLEAWKELSLGYVKLHQWNDALDATKKAVELAPDDLLLWQTLGQINVALRRPVDALEAFQQATTLNGRDVGSWVQQGMLNMQIRRLPDAKVAFEQALAVSPGDTEALCGAASLAQKEDREKDALALTQRVAAAGARCPEAPPVATNIVRSGPKPARKPH
jgi:tetratricopeptide (TPR) repeat protein